VGGGDDRARLEQLADRHGVLPRVLFTGEVPGHEKIDHYHLADAFAMPSTGEGFGIVFLEAAACGLPVLGGATDASRDPLRDGEMGVLVDPADPALLLEGLCQILSRERRVPESLRDFDFTNFEQQVCALFGAMSRSEDALVK
jgi:glycosyltransferase involved in cell wall biosynthesis